MESAVIRMFLCLITITMNNQCGHSFILSNDNVTSGAVDGTYRDLLSLIVRLTNRMDTMEAGLSGRLDSIDQLHTQVQGELDKERNTRQQMEDRMTRIETDVKHFKSLRTNESLKITELEQQLGVVRNWRDGFNTSLDNIDNLVSLERVMISNLNQSVYDLSFTLEMLNRSMALQNEPVGFSMKEPVSTLVNDALTFSSVMFNRGGMYNIQSGIFTCTIPGLYFFITTFVKSPGIREAYCILDVNDQGILGPVETGNGDYNGYLSGTNSFLYHLNSTDTVRLADCHGIDHLNKLTSFSGLLIHPDN